MAGGGWVAAGPQAGESDAMWRKVLLASEGTGGRGWRATAPRASCKKASAGGAVIAAAAASQDDALPASGGK